MAGVMAARKRQVALDLILAGAGAAGPSEGEAAGAAGAGEIRDDLGAGADFPFAGDAVPGVQQTVADALHVCSSKTPKSRNSSHFTSFLPVL